MFAPLSRFLPRRPDPAETEHAFLTEVRITHPREPRSRRLERVLMVCWLLVLVKSAAVWWACQAYAVPVNPWWIIAPTVFFAGICTWLYWRRD